MNPSEKRKNPRRSISYPALIDLGDNKPAVECTLCDVSQEGAQLTVADPAKLPNEFILALSHDGAARRNCRVMWRNDNQVGVEFLKDMKKGTRPRRHPMMRFVAPDQAAAEGPQAPGGTAAHQVDIETLASR